MDCGEPRERDWDCCQFRYLSVDCVFNRTGNQSPGKMDDDNNVDDRSCALWFSLLLSCLGHVVINDDQNNCTGRSTTDG